MRRLYGSDGAAPAQINAVLLFVVLIYIYPLKFLFTNLTDMVLGINGVVQLPDLPGQSLGGRRA